MHYKNRHNWELIQILLVYSMAFCLLDHKAAIHSTLLDLMYTKTPFFSKNISRITFLATSPTALAYLSCEVIGLQSTCK